MNSTKTMKTLRKTISIPRLALVLLVSSMASTSTITSVQAADYVVDNQGAHASINFKVKHLGYSWLTGRFDKFDGKFSYDDKNPAASSIEINIDTTSVNSNHAERDKHIKSDDFLSISKFATAKFSSDKVTDLGNNKLTIEGTLTLHGVSKKITIDATKIGEGKDPWGGYRVGFSGTTSITMKDFGIKMDLGPASAEVFFELNVEGVRQ